MGDMQKQKPADKSPATKWTASRTHDDYPLLQSLWIPKTRLHNPLTLLMHPMSASNGSFHDSKSKISEWEACIDLSKATNEAPKSGHSFPDRVNKSQPKSFRSVFSTKIWCFLAQPLDEFWFWKGDIPQNKGNPQKTGPWQSSAGNILARRSAVVRLWVEYMFSCVKVITMISTTYQQ